MKTSRRGLHSVIVRVGMQLLNIFVLAKYNLNILLTDTEVNYLLKVCPTEVSSIENVTLSESLE